MSYSSCKLSPKDVVVRKGSSLATFPEQKVLTGKRKDSSDFPKHDTDKLETHFIWHKKVKKEEKEKIPLQLLKKRQKRKAEENAKELEELKRMRKEREKIRQEAREVREKEERKRAAEQELAWSKEQEESFFLNQVPLRSQIRLEQGRAQPVDFLARYVTSVNQLDIENIETEDPLRILNNLAEQDLEDLIEDIKVYKRVHLQPNYQCSWNRLEQIANFMLSHAGTSSQRKSHPLNLKIEDEIASILNGKTISQLKHLKKNIEEKLQVNKDIDVSYWERLLQHIEVTMCRQSLLTEHDKYLKTILKMFREQKRKVSTNIDLSCVLQTNKSEEPKKETVLGAMQTRFLTVKETFLVPCEEENKIVSEEYDLKFLSFEELPQDITVVDADQDKELLTQARERILKNMKPRADYSIAPMKIPSCEVTAMDESSDRKSIEETRVKVLSQFRKQQEESLSKEEKLLNLPDDCIHEPDLNLEVPVAGLESDKYKPRKPRYLNKIQTGYFWNRYNRTHYDSNKPPPKMVLGYRFNIFYPDLMDKSVMPTYTVTPCKDNKDLSVIRFSAGPPYEDIAFQIVNDREWDKSERFGFKNWYRSGVLQLWFRFKKMSYRR